jgi:hypothetical protein
MKRKVVLGIASLALVAALSVLGACNEDSGREGYGIGDPLLATDFQGAWVGQWEGRDAKGKVVPFGEKESVTLIFYNNRLTIEDTNQDSDLNTAESGVFVYDNTFIRFLPDGGNPSSTRPFVRYFGHEITSEEEDGVVTYTLELTNRTGNSYNGTFTKE